MEIETFKSEVRKALAEYIASEGCTCCQDRESHEKASEKLGEMLGCEKYPDGSGYNFYKYSSKELIKG